MSTKETLKNENPFVRVGTTLYKIVSQPRLNGGHVKKRIVWNNETLRQDYGKDYLAGVPKYDGFCTVPDHVNYCQVIDNFLNLYEKEPSKHWPLCRCVCPRESLASCVQSPLLLPAWQFCCWV